jgi:hypothetical protein
VRTCVYGIVRVVEAGEEGIRTDVEESAEAVSAYEVDVNKLGLGRGYKGRDSRDLSYCESRGPISIGLDRGDLLMGGKAMPLDGGWKMHWGNIFRCCTILQG